VTTSGAAEDVDGDYEVMAVRFATRETSASEVFANYFAYGAPDRPMTMDYFFWVVRGRGATIVVDTGFTRATAEARARHVTCPVPEALTRAGVRPEDVSTVVLTHGHYDHTGNVGLFPGAQVLMARDEYEFLCEPVARRELLGGSVQWEDVEHLRSRADRGGVTLMSQTTEVAPGVVVEQVGGHTPGQLVVTVRTASRTVVLASDALHYYEELTADRPFSWFTDLRQVYRTFDRLADLSRQPAVDLVAGHDPAVLSLFPPLVPDEPGLGVRVA
jgi:glyoxylase-like metal-dependent hydrolase (beta-lactamase superfamily II)